MTDKQKIAKLEERLAWLEARCAMLEARPIPAPVVVYPQPIYPLWPRTPLYPTITYYCGTNTTAAEPVNTSTIKVLNAA